MFNGWPRKVMIGVSAFGGLTYVGVYSAGCWAKEPSESEPVPLAAALTGTAATTTASAAPSVAMTVTAFHPNMTGDEAIKVVELTPGGSLLWKRQRTL